MYAVTAQVVTRKNATNIESSRQIPTFFLDENVQGFTDEAGAEKIARKILEAGVSAHPNAIFEGNSITIGGYVTAFYVTAVKL